MAASSPNHRKVSDIKSSLLRPALTSHFEVFIVLPSFMKGENLVQQDQLNLQCTEASLPGSSLATFEINNDHHGVTERHAYRRIFDERIDLTFYVDAGNYLPIRTFERWIGGIMNGNGDDGNLPKSSHYYTARYPNDYRTDLYITKFERSYGQDGSNIKYTFVKAFPISISAMPVSYDSSSLLKCTVGFTYLRYFTGTPEAKGDTQPKVSDSPATANPDQNTALQDQAKNTTLQNKSESDTTTTTPKIEPKAALLGGRTLNRRDIEGYRRLGASEEEIRRIQAAVGDPPFRDQ